MLTAIHLKQHFSTGAEAHRLTRRSDLILRVCAQPELSEPGAEDYAVSLTNFYATEPRAGSL